MSRIGLEEEVGSGIWGEDRVGLEEEVGVGVGIGEVVWKGVRVVERD